MDPILGSALVAGGTSLLGNLFGGLFGSSSSKTMAQNNLQAVRETNQANRELVEYQNEENLKRWHMQNAYDSPVAQMARYREANLNPYLMQADGAQSVSQSMPAAERATMQAYQQTENPGQYWSRAFADMGNSIGNAVMQKYQMDQMNAQTIKTMADAKGQTILNKYQEQYLGSQYIATIKNMMADTKKKEQEIKNMEMQKELIKISVDHEKVKKLETFARIANTRTQTELLGHEIQNAIAQNGLIKAQIVGTYSSAKAANAMASLSYAQQRLVTEQAVEQVYRNRMARFGLNPEDGSFTNVLIRMVLDPEAYSGIDIPKNLATIATNLKQQFDSAKKELEKAGIKLPSFNYGLSLGATQPYVGVPDLSSTIK